MLQQLQNDKEIFNLGITNPYLGEMGSILLNLLDAEVKWIAMVPTLFDLQEDTTIQENPAK